jgi:hypothetical protein
MSTQLARKTLNGGIPTVRCVPRAVSALKTCSAAFIPVRYAPRAVEKSRRAGVRRVRKPGNGDDPSLIEPVAVHTPAELALPLRLN